MMDRDPRLVIAGLAARVEDCELRVTTLERALAQAGLVLSEFMLTPAQQRQYLRERLDEG